MNGRRYAGAALRGCLGTVVTVIFLALLIIHWQMALVVAGLALFFAVFALLVSKKPPTPLDDEPLTLRERLRASGTGALPSDTVRRKGFPKVTRWRIMLAGASHPSREGNVDRRTIYRALKPGDGLLLRREPINEFDTNCIAVFPADGDAATLDIGFIPRTMAKLLAPKMDRGAEFTAKVDRVAVYGKREQFVRCYIEVEMTKPPGKRPP